MVVVTCMVWSMLEAEVYHDVMYRVLIKDTLQNNELVMCKRVKRVSLLKVEVMRNVDTIAAIVTLHLISQMEGYSVYVGNKGVCAQDYC